MRSGAAAVVRDLRLGRVMLLLAMFAGWPAAFSQQQQEAAGAALEREFQAAMAAQDRGDVEGAKRKLLELRQKHSGVFAIDESLGLIYVAQEKFDEALPLLEAAAKDEPSSDVAHANLGA